MCLWPEEITVEGKAFIVEQMNQTYMFTEATRLKCISHNTKNSLKAMCPWTSKIYNMSLIFRCFLSCTNNFADMDILQLITLNIYTGIEIY